MKKARYLPLMALSLVLLPALMSGCSRAGIIDSSLQPGYSATLQNVAVVVDGATTSSAFSNYLAEAIVSQLAERGVHATPIAVSNLERNPVAPLQLAGFTYVLTLRGKADLPQNGGSLIGFYCRLTDHVSDTPIMKAELRAAKLMSDIGTVEADRAATVLIEELEKDNLLPARG